AIVPDEVNATAEPEGGKVIDKVPPLSKANLPSRHYHFVRRRVNDHPWGETTCCVGQALLPSCYSVPASACSMIAAGRSSGLIRRAAAPRRCCRGSRPGRRRARSTATTPRGSVARRVIVCRRQGARGGGRCNDSTPPL